MPPTLPQAAAEATEKLISRENSLGAEDLQKAWPCSIVFVPGFNQRRSSGWVFGARPKEFFAKLPGMGEKGKSGEKTRRNVQKICRRRSHLLGKQRGGEAKERGEEKAGVRAGAGNQVTQKLKQ